MLYPSNQDLAILAKKRRMLHTGQASQNVLRDEPFGITEYISLLGERAFAMYFNVAMDLRLLPAGDRGVDFRFKCGTVDVKTSSGYPWVLVKEGHLIADYYVLAMYNDQNDDAPCVGWCSKEDLLRGGLHPSPFGHKNYKLHQKDLRPLNELETILEIC